MKAAAIKLSAEISILPSTINILLSPAEPQAPMFISILPSTINILGSWNDD